ncbi:MAG TPA: MBL fold metallo-hydrolase [Chitinophagaceae bacterium]
MTSVNSGKLREVRPDVAYYTDQIVNVVMLGEPTGDWVLVDAGMPKHGDQILRVCEKRFGENHPPSAIVLTHGHFDHVGSITELLSKWNVPVYAHPFEFPFLTGKTAYPEPDASVEGGILAKLSFLYPHEAIDISERLKPVPSDHTIPGIGGWRWLHVPGHSPGQIALFRDTDRVLIAGDAFVTVEQDSLYRVLLQKEEVCGPPVYLTADWHAASRSVERLAALDPEVAITGHGTAMHNSELKDGLRNLIDRWHEVAVPEHGKWVTDNQVDGIDRI